jgi:hypothetical protein
MEIFGERIEPWVTVREEPEIRGQEPQFSMDKVATSVPDVTYREPDYDPGDSSVAVFDSQEPESKPLPKEPPVSPMPPRGPGFKPGKKILLVIIAVIIIIAIVIGGFLLYPMIANNSGTPSGDGNSLTPLPTVVKTPSSAVTPVKTPKPSVKPTFPGGPGNSPANAGF